MKEFVLKHPILTFLLASALIDALKSFAPGKKEETEDKAEDAEDAAVPHIEKNKEETK